MLKTKFVIIKWIKPTRKHYEEKGYIFTNYLDEFEIKVEDLTHASTMPVVCVCDYCGKEIEKPYHQYLSSHKRLNKDCCGDSKCQYMKRSEVCMKENNVYHYSKLPQVMNKVSNSQKTPYNKIQNDFLKRNFTLFTSLLEYESMRTTKDKLSFVCNNHKDYGIQNILIEDFNMGKGCRLCGFERTANLQKLDFNIVKEKFKSLDYILLDDIYINAQTDLHYICNKHKNKGIQTIKWNHLQQGEGCYYCSWEKRSGENHHNWQGGISNINIHLRQLLNKWIQDILKYHNFKCFVSGVNDILVVHHIYSFNLIVREVFDSLKIEYKPCLKDYSDEELYKIDDIFLQRHTIDMGVPILPEIHKIYHDLYGWNNNKIQFEEFISRFDNHEFDKLLNLKVI